EGLKSRIADLQNVGGEAGTITAGLFLEEFVDGVPWAHLDIAGPAFTEKDLPHAPRGGTGFGVRLLVRYLRDLAIWRALFQVEQLDRKSVVYGQNGEGWE